MDRIVEPIMGRLYALQNQTRHFALVTSGLVITDEGRAKVRRGQLG